MNWVSVSCWPGVGLPDEHHFHGLFVFEMDENRVDLGVVLGKQKFGMSWADDDPATEIGHRSLEISINIWQE